MQTDILLEQNCILDPSRVVKSLNLSTSFMRVDEKVHSFRVSNLESRKRIPN